MGERTEKAKKYRRLIPQLAMLVFTGAALLIGVVITAFNSTLGWFANNRSVTGGNMTAAMAGSDYELAVTNEQMTEYAADSSIVQYLTENSPYTERIAMTGGPHVGLICKMVDEVVRDDGLEGLAPGSYGYISFEIVVPAGDARAFDISLSLLPLAYDVSLGPVPAFSAEGLTDPAEIAAAEANETILENLVSGHILFFESRSDNGVGGYYYDDILLDDVIRYDLAAHAADKRAEADGDHYTVNIYWCWPATFSRMTLGRGDKLFASPLFETAETRAPMIADVKAHHEKYFYDYEESEIDFDDPDYPNTYYVYLSEGYNRGDQFIGDHVHYLVVVANVADAAPEEP